MIDIAWDWTLIVVQCVIAGLLGIIGLVMLLGVPSRISMIVSGRRTESGRRRLDLIREARMVTRIIENSREKPSWGATRGKDLHVSFPFRFTLTPLSTPMARELASWHGMEHVRRYCDIKIGTYPIVFHDPSR
ncbi:hypothetical protein [Pseudonocardia sp. HH130630-07]|uniref:hypothetical protein n=1 Tax=Pseudonocardia sp. HH130630-07 TaxID=1690815 RepID=UPI000815075B|nr:hypothetical protein [Pseudonocardia sp. HH130630-07]ANY08232.1 hypothetical protein AFB00_20320 [Pseudonocardia sp. HH130630-07]